VSLTPAQARPTHGRSASGSRPAPGTCCHEMNYVDGRCTGCGHTVQGWIVEGWIVEVRELRARVKELEAENMRNKIVDRFGGME